MLLHIHLHSSFINHKLEDKLKYILDLKYI